jgi:hypothetical protein
MKIVLYLLGSIVTILTVIILIRQWQFRRNLKKQSAKFPVFTSPRPGLIYFSKQLPFQPDEMQIIYVEKDFSPVINAAFQEHYKEISEMISQKGYRLFYAPAISSKIQDTEYLKYNFPGIQPDKIKTANFQELNLLQYLLPESEVSCGFLRLKLDGETKYGFSKFEFDEQLPLISQVETYLGKVGEDPIFFSLGRPDSEDDVADFNFWQKSRELMDDVKAKISELRMLGVEEMLIRNLVEIQHQLSTVKISNDNRIFLPEFQKEIKMAPLPKAVFLLFLQHPEGILFKNLPDYRAELLSIYNKLAHTDDREITEKSIVDVTDPSSNSINEKCSRIREAFLREMNDEIARHYYVTGNRGEVKKIELNRDLVAWEEEK